MIYIYHLRISSIVVPCASGEAHELYIDHLLAMISLYVVIPTNDLGVSLSEETYIFYHHVSSLKRDGTEI